MADDIRDKEPGAIAAPIPGFPSKPGKRNAQGIVIGKDGKP